MRIRIAAFVLKEAILPIKKCKNFIYNHLQQQQELCMTKRRFGVKSLVRLIVILVVFAVVQPARSATPPIPEKSQLKLLVNDTLLHFAQAINAKDFSEFYQTIAKRWQAQITEDELATAFQTFTDQNVDLTGLHQLEPIFSEPPALNRDGLLVVQGKYPTHVFTTDFTLKYFYEERSWKLFGISLDIQPAAVPSVGNADLPAETELNTLMQTTMRDFAEGVNTKDFSNFYDTIALLWQAQTSPEALKEAFLSFIEQEMDLTGLQDAAPFLIRPPALNEKGWLILEGHYPTQPSVTYFSLGYLYEASSWKLGSIDLKVTQEIPPIWYLQALADNSMADFAAGVKARDFAEFYRNIAQLWQEQTTIEELAASFQTFSDQQIDLSVLRGMTPVFTETPAINAQDWLTLEGTYPTQPSVVYFTLKYLFEAPYWKLVGININVK